MSEIKLIEKLPIERWVEYKELYINAVKKEPLAFSETIEEVEKVSEEDWKTKITNVLNDTSILIFAESDGKIIGMGGASFHNREKLKHNAFLSSLYVMNDFRKKGIGKQIIEKRIEIILKNKYIKNIFCEIVETQKSSIELHKKLGFEVVGEFKNLLYIDGKFYTEYYLQKQIS